MSSGLSIGALALALLLVAPPAWADIFRCRHGDGTTTFTSNPSSCPSGSRLHEPKGSIQIVPGAGRPIHEQRATPPRARGGAAAQAEDAQESMWRRKRVEAERELAGLESGAAQFQRLVTFCNRGGELTVEDEVGLRKKYSCDQVRRDWEEAQAREILLRAYLGGGLEDECRRAGCLPGWIR